jgi:hypothetical protein
MKFEPGHYKLFDQPQNPVEWREFAGSSGYDFSALDRLFRDCLVEIKAQEPARAEKAEAPGGEHRTTQERLI